MKNIVVPTDFSSIANNALRYAIELANEFGSKIFLINGMDIVGSTSIYTDVNNIMHDTSIQKLTDSIEEMSQYRKGKTLLVPEVIRGDLTYSICDFAKKVNADLIVMGTKGASELKEVFIGTIAQGVVSHSSIPVLVIPEEVRFERPKKIVLAVDEKPLQSKSTLSVCKGLASYFEANLELFHFNKAYEYRPLDASVGDSLRDVNYSTHEQFSSINSINEAIQRYIGIEEPDMLVMIRRKRSFLSRLFHKSVTNKEIFRSKLPVLILEEND